MADPRDRLQRSGPGRRPSYTPELVYALLTNYQRLALGSRLPRREERLGSRQAPAHEAPWAATSRLRADVETALRSLPLDQLFLLFMHVCLGDSSWNRGASTKLAWRSRVADWWDTTPGTVNAETRAAIEAVCERLNGATTPLSEVARVCPPGVAYSEPLPSPATRNPTPIAPTPSPHIPSRRKLLP